MDRRRFGQLTALVALGASLPRMALAGEWEAVLAEAHRVLGPGGKGSNQSVAAAMAGGRVHFITRLGDDDFATMARGIWAMLTRGESYRGPVLIGA